MLKKIVIISKNSTNGDVMKKMFPDYNIKIINGMIYFFNPNGGWVNYDIDWWYSSYNIK